MTAFSKFILLCILMFSIGMESIAQNYITTQHYSVDDGMYENHALCMLQDKKGVMWFGTFSGLDKFDGYTFKNYKGAGSGSLVLDNFRIDRLKEDQQGNLWIRTNDVKFYRFDPSTENFLPVPSFSPEFDTLNVRPDRVNILENGDIWMYSTNSNHGGCFLIQNISENEKPTLSYFSQEDGHLASNKIFKIYQDKDEKTWILTANGLSVYDSTMSAPKLQYHDFIQGELYAAAENKNQLFIGGNKGVFFTVDKETLNVHPIKTEFKNQILELFTVDNNQVLLITNSNCIYQYNTSTHNLTKIYISEDPIKVNGAYMDQKYRIWFDTDYKGAIYYETKNQKLHHLQVDEYNIPEFIRQDFNFIEDVNGNIWVQVKQGGFYHFNEKENKLETLTNNKSIESDLSFRVHSALADKQGNLWLSTFLQGIDKVVYHRSSFSFIQPIKAPDFSLQNEIRAIFTDHKNRIWAATKKGKLFIYDKNLKLLGQLGPNGNINDKQSIDGPVYSIMQDNSGVIWLATKGSGIYGIKEKADGKFDIENFQHDPNDPNSISSNAIYTIFEDSKFNIWIGTFGGGLNLLNQRGDTLKFIHQNNTLKNYPIEIGARIRHISQDSSGNLLIGTTHGLLVCNNVNDSPENLLFRRYFHDTANPNSIPGNDIQYILPTKDGKTYLALLDGNVVQISGDLKSDSTSQFNHVLDETGNLTKIANAMIEDEKGNIWISFQSQIAKLDPKNGHFESYKPFSEIPYFFSESTTCKTKYGKILFGTSNGFIQFDPEKTVKSNYQPPLILTDFQIFNKSVSIQYENSPLKKSIDETDKIILTHKQNNFSISFAALDYTAPENIKYAYKLDGLEEDWNYVHNLRTANYVNLPKGEYTFHVKSTNADGNWVQNERQLTIIKRPSFFESTWGTVFYLLLFVLLSSLTAYILFVIFRLRNEITVEKRLADLKLKFFTNISHELRTPLTLIVSPIDYLLRKESLSKNARGQLLSVKKNTDRLLKMINQILDFRKIESKKMKLFIEAAPVNDLMREIRDGFKNQSEMQNIDFSLQDDTNNAMVWVDRDKFEKIIFNLLSNAFKFTPKNKSIEILVDEDGEFIHITIHDQGVGMAKDRLKLLFNRFENFDTSTTSQASTGIGLSLVKELVNLHHGKIDVQSETGKGTAFKVSFRKGFAHFGKAEEILIKDTLKPEIPVLEPGTDVLNQTQNESIPIDSSKPENKVMVVEDNEELLQFLTNALNSNYKVISASDGRQALALAAEENPDIVISDIMMPDVDGMELTRTLKSNFNTSHIPLILLTAKTDLESKLLAMEIGADDYITKPFNLSFLEARIENLLRIRRQMQTYFKSTLTTGVIALSKPKVTHVDEAFLQKVMLFLEENFENSEFTIDTMAENLGVGRSSFFKKLKSLTGISPIEFVREFRLQKATQFIESGETNISQLAYRVGLNDARYFSKCFKQKFGVTPSEYIIKLR